MCTYLFARMTNRITAPISSIPLDFGFAVTAAIVPEVPGEPAGGAAAATEAAVFLPTSPLPKAAVSPEAPVEAAAVLGPPGLPKTAASPPGAALGPAEAFPGVLTNAGIEGLVSVGALPAAGVQPEDGLYVMPGALMDCSFPTVAGLYSPRVVTIGVLLGGVAQLGGVAGLPSPPYQIQFPLPSCAHE